MRRTLALFLSLLLLTGCAPAEPDPAPTPPPLEPPVLEGAFAGRDWYLGAPGHDYYLRLLPEDDDGVDSDRVGVFVPDREGTMKEVWRSERCFRRRDALLAAWDDTQTRFWLYSGDLGSFAYTRTLEGTDWQEIPHSAAMADYVPAALRQARPDHFAPEPEPEPTTLEELLSEKGMCLYHMEYLDGNRESYDDRYVAVFVGGEPRSVQPFLLNPWGQVLESLPIYQGWNVFDLLGTAVEDLDGDGDADVLLSATYCTGVGEYGAVPIPFLLVYLQGEAGFTLANGLDERFEPLWKNPGEEPGPMDTLAAEVRKLL